VIEILLSNNSINDRKTRELHELHESEESHLCEKYELREKYKREEACWKIFCPKNTLDIQNMFLLLIMQYQNL
jgi:hypothetical protein